MTSNRMLKTRSQIEKEERKNFSQFGQCNAESAGRKHPEPPHSYRTAFQRDRARIIHSRAFRRLEYKTQVFLNGTGDHLRTRLTHTIEVASVSRNHRMCTRSQPRSCRSNCLGSRPRPPSFWSYRRKKTEPNYVKGWRL